MPAGPDRRIPLPPSRNKCTASYAATVPSAKASTKTLGLSGWNAAATTAVDENEGRSEIGRVLSNRFVTCMVGGLTDADKRRWEVDEIANTVGGDG